MRTWMLIALAGGFGGTAPNIFRVGSSLTKGAALPEISYMIGVSIFFVMGAGVALAFQEEDFKKAFFLGLSLPAMFQSGAADVTTANASMLPPAIMAVAEEPPRMVKVYYNADAPEFSFIFSGAQRGREEVLLLARAEKKKDDGRDVVGVPAWATSFTVLVLAERQMSKPSEILNGEWDVRIEERALRGLKQSIGIKDAERWNITIKERARKK